MNCQKGFNLFTALIALMLVSITIVFIYNMVQTEENYLSLIETQSKTSDLLTIADLSRADAFNIFVVSFRENWARHRNLESNKLILGRADVILDWDRFVENFANKIFFDKSFEDYFAINVTQALSYTNPPIGYSLQVPFYNREDLSSVIRKSFDLAEEKIEVIGCEHNNNCLGTLYFTIDTRNLTAEDYEKLPMIVVRRYSDDEVIQRPVFSRREYRIYLPWRGFQALRSVRNFALGAEVENEQTTSEIVTALPTSQGFFNPLIYNTFNSARLGVCDIGTCGLREDLFKTSDKDGFQNSCRNPSSVGVVANDGQGINIQGTVINLSENRNYNLSNIQNTGLREIFEDLVETSVENNIISRTDVLNSGPVSLSLETSGNIGYENFNIYKARVNFSPYVTKEVVSDNPLGKAVSSFSQHTFNPSSFNETTNLSYYIAGNLYNDFNISYFKEINRIDQTSDNMRLRCNKINSINLLFKFVENNSKYKVISGEQSIYVELEDNFPEYSFHNDFYSQGFSNGYWQSNINVQSLISTNNNWVCHNYEGQTQGSAACVSSNS